MAGSKRNATNKWEAENSFITQCKLKQHQSVKNKANGQALAISQEAPSSQLASLPLSVSTEQPTNGTWLGMGQVSLLVEPGSRAQQANKCSGLCCHQHTRAPAVGPAGSGVAPCRVQRQPGTVQHRLSTGSVLVRHCPARWLAPCFSFYERVTGSRAPGANCLGGWPLGVTCTRFLLSLGSRPELRRHLQLWWALSASREIGLSSDHKGVSRAFVKCEARS